jgi:hypothetical protein
MIRQIESSVLARVIEPEKDDLPPEVARYLLRLKFGDTDRDRMNELAAKARGGTLGNDETDELDTFVLVGHMLALMQSKARQTLKACGPEI